MYKNSYHTEESKRKMRENHADFSKEKHPRYKYIPKKQLYDLYWRKELSINKISKKLRYSEKAIRNRLIEYNISRRTLSKALRGKHCSPKTEFKKGQHIGKDSFNFGKPPKPKWGIYKGINMRSSWEIKYAKYLDRNNINWQYESKTFDLGNTTYTPDFKLSDNVYVEIKGYMSEEIYLKIKNFLKQYPNIKLQILMQKDLKKLGIL